VAYYEIVHTRRRVFWTKSQSDTIGNDRSHFSRTLQLHCKFRYCHKMLSVRMSVCLSVAIIFSIGWAFLFSVGHSQSENLVDTDSKQFTILYWQLTIQFSSHGWVVISRYWSKSVLFNGAGSLLPQILDRKRRCPLLLLVSVNQSVFAISQWKLHDPIFIHLDTIAQRDRQTDGRTELP